LSCINVTKVASVHGSAAALGDWDGVEMSKILITIFVILILIAALRSLWQKRHVDQPNASRSSGLQLDDLIRRLMNSKKDGAFLIVGVQGSEDFLQMTSVSTRVQLDFPLITDRQQSLESNIRRAAANQKLIVKEQRGSDDSRFLDIDIDGEPTHIAAVCRRFMEQVYGASEARFRYEHDGLSW
jgi:hypothetical protein